MNALNPVYTADEPSGGSSVGRMIRNLLSFIPSALVSEPRRETAASSGRLPVITSSTNPLYDTYYRHLSVMGHGIPVWIPGPNENLSADYRKQGTSVGDVVYFTNDGALDFLFNVCHPADHVINSCGVPEGFKPFALELTSSDTRRYHQYGTNAYVASKSIVETTRGRDVLPASHGISATHPHPAQSLHDEQATGAANSMSSLHSSSRASTAEGTTGVLFTSSASEGAILAMPEGAHSEDISRVSGFYQYLSDNLASWYEYVNGDRQWGVEMGRLHLVTGVHKAKAWGIATFKFAEETAAVDVRLQLKAEDIHPRMYLWEYSGITDYPRTGPTVRERQSLNECLPTEERGESFENQCLFVRTINSAIRDPQEMKDLHADGIANILDNHAQSSPLESSAGGIGSRRTSSALDLGETHKSLPGEFGASYNFPIAQNGPMRRDHPSQIINTFLLQEKPNGRIAITHDEDWISLLTESDVVIPAGPELLARLRKAYRIVEDEGIISLKSVGSDTTPETSDSAAVSMQRTEIPSKSSSMSNPIIAAQYSEFKVVAPGVKAVYPEHSHLTDLHAEHKDTPDVENKNGDGDPSDSETDSLHASTSSTKLSLDKWINEFNNHHGTDGSDNRHEDKQGNNNGSDNGSDSEASPPDATTGIVKLSSDEFPTYFSERNDRLFHSSTTSPYPLPVDTPEQERLAALHDLLRQLVGANFVGPVAEVLAQQTERQRIALDVCTGNGTWVLEMAADFPHVHFRGFDIVPIATRYPPRNVQFEITDVNSPLRWANGTFDLVHSRSVDMAVIDYREFAHEAARILRPGGLFVSYEWSPYPAFDPSMQYNPVLHAPASTRYHAAINAALARRGLRPLGSLVPSYLTEVGAFADIVPREYYVPIGSLPSNHPMQKIGRACHLAQEQYASSIRPLLVEAGWTEDQVDELVTDYFLELNSTRGLVSILYTVHARRM